MSSHVFTRNESYYLPGRGVVDFQLGEKVDPVAAIPDSEVRNLFIRRESLVPVESEKGAAAEAKKAAEPVQPEEFIAPAIFEIPGSDASEDVPVVAVDAPPAPAKQKGRQTKSAG